MGRERVIQIDSREHLRERRRIEKGFEEIGQKYICSKLYVGDYAFLDNPLVCVDRKQGLQELCGNLTQDHERIRKEFMKAMGVGVKLIILCEFNTLAPSCLEDVRRWYNPRLRANPKATTGETLYKIMKTMGERYGITYEFCMKKDTPRRIIEILERER